MTDPLPRPALQQPATAPAPAAAPEVVGPKLGVSAAIWRDGAVLLVRRGRGAYRGLWSLPGGHVAFGERLDQAIRRELIEETGIEAGPLRQIDTVEIIAADDDGRAAVHYVLAVFAGRFAAGTTQAGDDAAEAAWFAPSLFGTIEMTPQTRALLAAPHGQEHRAEPGAGERTTP